MDIVAVVTSILTLTDWIIKRAEMSGEEVPPEVLAERTKLRQELAAESARRAEGG